MEFKIKSVVSIDVKQLYVNVRPRYWEDSSIDGVDDEDGILVPCRDGDDWILSIDVERGKILNWPLGVTARIHYKVCDNGIYKLLGEGEIVLLERGVGRSNVCYVPKCLMIDADGWDGDYVILDIDASGVIKDFNFSLVGFDVEEVD